MGQSHALDWPWELNPGVSLGVSLIACLACQGSVLAVGSAPARAQVSETEFLAARENLLGEKSKLSGALTELGAGGLELCKTGDSMVRRSNSALAILAVVSSGLIGATANAQSAPERNDFSEWPITFIQGVAPGFADGYDDPGVVLQRIRIRAAQQKGLIPWSPIQPVRDGWTHFKDTLYSATYLKLGVSFHHAFQGASEVLPGTRDRGAATDMDFVGTWELFNRGQPTQGEISFGVEGRWQYAPWPGPQNLGFVNIATAGGTANTYSEYNPRYILRNLYYRQGGPEAGWVFRVGRITTDALLLTNRHLSPNATFLPNAGTGLFVAGFPDSGFGAAGARYFGDRVYVGGAIADSNANRFTVGDIGAGDFYSALELGLKLFPLTKNASYSKFTLWHTDGTKDGRPINGNTGEAGWGFAFVVEQELTADGRLVLLGRYGRSYSNAAISAAIYDQQAGVHLLLYQPTGWFDDDVVGTAFNWIDSAYASSSKPLIPSRHESNWEIFYRFPLLPDVDTTFSYQAIWDPAFANTPKKRLDFSSVFSLRLTTSF